MIRNLKIVVLMLTVFYMGSAVSNGPSTRNHSWKQSYMVKKGIPVLIFGLGCGLTYLAHRCSPYDEKAGAVLGGTGLFTYATYKILNR